MEAMAAGCPIIATRVGGVASTVGGEAAILVEPEDAPALAAAMRTLLSDADLCRHMGQAGRNRVRAMFDVRRTAREHEELYHRLLAERGIGA
jgi:glycosyltransferase involved in cell wall biosynthesis